jgi:protein TonB
MPVHPRCTLVRALIVSLLAHAGLLFSVGGIFPGRVDAPARVLQVAMRGENLAGNAPAPPAAKEALSVPLDAPPPAPVIAEKPPAPANAPLPVPVAVKPAVRDEAPARPKTPRSVARKPAISDSRSKEIAHPAPPSFTASMKTATSLSAISSAAGNASSDGSPDDAPREGAAIPSEGAPARRNETCTDDDIHRYRSALQDNARRFKRYPPLAKEQGWEGSAGITLVFRDADAAPALSLTASSGHRILDEQALETLRQAIRRTERPAGLKGRDCRMRQVVSFSLEDDR